MSATTLAVGGPGGKLAPSWRSHECHRGDDRRRIARSRWVSTQEFRPTTPERWGDPVCDRGRSASDVRASSGTLFKLFSRNGCGYILY